MVNNNIEQPNNQKEMQNDKKRQITTTKRLNFIKDVPQMTIDG